jgi:hypothetical protein
MGVLIGQEALRRMDVGGRGHHQYQCQQYVSQCFQSRPESPFQRANDNDDDGGIGADGPNAGSLRN